MNELGLRQKAVLAIVVMVVLYFAAIGYWFAAGQKAWSRAAKAYRSERTRFEKEENLIAQRRTWDDSYEAAKKAMPVFAADKMTDTTWMSKVEALAKTNLVVISQIDHGDEIVADDVLELPIEVRAFEASLEALVKFMHALENSEDGMFNIEALSVKPSNKPGYLKGSMSLTCAYMRESKQGEGMR